MRLPRQLCLLCILGCWLVFTAGAATSGTATNSLVWNQTADRVSANLHGEPLWPLLEDIAHQTGWHIFVEPGSTRAVSTKFKNLPSGEALHMLLGDLNFALVPQTNSFPRLYVFRTTMQNATQPVAVNLAPKHVPNELIVKLKPGVDIDAIAKALGAKVIGRNEELHIYKLQFPDEAGTDAALGQLKTNSDVEAVDYNYILDPPVMPQPLASVPANAAPVSLTLNPNTPNDPCNPVVGLIDMPMQSLGSQLDPFITTNISIAGNPGTLSTTMPTHGTAMAQTILRAVGQAGGGSSSVRIVGVDVYGANETTTSWNVALGVQAAVDNGATVLNMSLGGTGDSTVLDSIIQQALAKGVAVFAAAGNQPVNTPTYPAAIPGVNAVTALGAPGQLASYANYGNFVGMALPGASVVYLGNQAYVVQGTSPATAYATGVAAGTKGVDCLPWSQIQSAMDQKFPVPQK